VKAGQNVVVGIDFQSTVGPIKIASVPKKLQESVDGFTAWCKLSQKIVNGQNRFIFMQEEVATNNVGGVVKIATNSSNGVIANNDVGKPNEQKKVKKEGEAKSLESLNLLSYSDSKMRPFSKCRYKF
jgi:hypothetical protein